MSRKSTSTPGNNFSKKHLGKVCRKNIIKDLGAKCEELSNSVFDCEYITKDKLGNNINLVINNCNLDRMKLNNELEKIETYFQDKVLKNEQLSILLNSKTSEKMENKKSSKCCLIYFVNSPDWPRGGASGSAGSPGGWAPPRRRRARDPRRRDDWRRERW